MKNRKNQWIGSGIILLLVVFGGLLFNGKKFSDSENPPPNIIFILTDDLDFSLMPYMENTNKLIGQEGTTFTNYFVTSSACCPSRASTLRGQYPHNTTILENSPGFEQFYRNGKDEDTIATWMKSAGYKNSYLGKYMNLYPAGVKRSYISPGWADWHVFLYENAPHFYFAYTMNENGKLVRCHKKAEEYSTDVIREKSVEFIKAKIKKGSPFFIFISVYAPHGPSIPAPRHSGLFKDLEYPQSPSFHEEDTSDKPSIIRDLRKTGGLFEAGEANNLFIRRVQSMQAVDELVAELVHLLEQNGQLDNTYIFFTSDNGFHMGEHSLPSGKMLAYEEDIHVPLLVRGPGIQPGTTITQITANIDIAPSIAELAGERAAEYIDGRSFVPFFSSPSEEGTEWRKALLIETGNLEGVSHGVSYRGIRSEKFIYVEYESGELEFYDLITDLYELNNIAQNLDAETLSILHSWLEQLKTCRADDCRIAEMALPDHLKYQP